jgi:triacylglycerol esterase/lipase EstA (alpha/beta hydrolase family)
MLPTVILPGYFEEASAYRTLQAELEAMGSKTEIVPLRKLDWFPTVGGRSMVPILEQLEATIARIGSEKINLVGHSAGGWIARIYLGDVPYNIHGQVKTTAKLWGNRDRVATLVTLGTPHVTREKWAIRNLDFVNDNYPGAFHPEVKYICVAGKSVYGARKPGQWLAFSSYRLTVGEGSTWGDGITPIAAAHLEGAENVILENVSHAPRSTGLWYGSPTIVPSWANLMA